MELDKRVKEGKRPLTCFDLEDASGFLKKTGYFANELDYFSDLSKVNECCSEVYFGKLLAIKDNKRCLFKYLSMDCSREASYRFFLPEDWVLPEEPKKKYRAFTLAEWIDQHEIGEVIRFRNTCNQEFNVMYLGYILDTNDDIQDIRTKGQIMFVSTPYTLQELFEHYEIYVDGEWQPFGVLDEEKE